MTKSLTGHAITFNNKLFIEKIEEHMYDRHRYWFFWYGKTSRAKALAVVRGLQGKPSRMPIINKRYYVEGHPHNSLIFFVQDSAMQITLLHNINLDCAQRIVNELNKLNHGSN